MGCSLGERMIVDRPQIVENINEEIVMVSCGFRHTLFLSENGKVYGVGSNKKHEMGLGNSPQSQQPNILTPIRLVSLEMYMISSIKAGFFSAALTS